MQKFRENLKGHDEYAGFYFHPVQSEWVLSTEGVVKCSITGEAINTEIGFYPYPMLDRKKADGLYLLHRLMAETFLECPGDPKELVVNHKNGDKLDARISNLEWCTRSENATHAYKEGLRPDNIVMYVKNLLTEEVKSIYSMQELARVFEVNAENIYRYLRTKAATQLPYKLIYEISNNGTDWVVPKENINAERFGGHTNRQIVLKSLTENKILIFKSIYDASEYLDISTGNLYSALNGKSFRLDKRGWSIFYRDKFHESLSGISVQGKERVKAKPIPPTRKPAPITVLDTITNTVLPFKTCQDFADHIGAKKNTVQKNVLVNNGMYKQFKITYI